MLLAKYMQDINPTMIVDKLNELLSIDKNFITTAFSTRYKCNQKLFFTEFQTLPYTTPDDEEIAIAGILSVINYLFPKININF